jgi:membrane associated rhomboid family serine protease
LSDLGPTWIEVSRQSVRKTAEEHSLVLEARGIASGVVVVLDQNVVLVPVADAERARAELANYVRENQERPARDEAPPSLQSSVGAALVFAAVLVGLDLASRRQLFGLDWRAGVADAVAIRGGAWWRSITALWLHADSLHLVSNLAFGSLFGVMLAQSVGVGCAWLAFVVTGGLGNWLNAWLQLPPHLSVGASTAVFGMLGVQAAHDWVRRRELHHNLFRRWAPIAIGAALLAWLGGEGEGLRQIDVGAHVLGFGVGLVLGGLIGWRQPEWRASTWLQAAAAAAAAALVALAWALALA